MQNILAVITAGASVLGLVYANLPRRNMPRSSRWRAMTAAGLRPLLIFTVCWLLVFFLLTTPTFPPFSSGLTLGWGFLIGGILGLYAFVAASGEMPDRYARTVGLLSAAALGPALILLIFHGYPNEALVGCALGAVLVGAIASSTLRPLAANSDGAEADARSAYRGVEVFALLTTAIAAGTRLAIEHFPAPANAPVYGGYWAFPVLMVMAGTLAVILLSYERPGKWQRWSALLNGIGAAAVMVILTAVLQVKLLPALAWQLPLYGLLAFGFVLAVFMRERQAEEGEDFRPVTLAFAAVLLALVVVAVAFQQLQGYGEALALLPALLLVAVTYLGYARRSEPVGESLAVGGVSVVLLLMLYRLFLETTGRGWRLDFQQQYDLFSLLLGAGACFGLLAFAARGMARAQQVADAGKSSLRVLLARTVLLGIFVTAAPVALAAVWGVKSVGAFLAGLVVGEAVWMLLAAWTVGKERAHVLMVAPHLFFVAAALIAVQFSPLAISADFSRMTKLAILGAITLGILIWVFIDAIGRAREADRRRLAAE